MVTTDPSVLAAEHSLHPLIERRLRARSEEDVHDRARAITTGMEAEGWVLVARSWVNSERGGTLTLAFAQRSAGEPK